VSEAEVIASTSLPARPLQLSIIISVSSRDELKQISVTAILQNTHIPFHMDFLFEIESRLFPKEGANFNRFSQSCQLAAL